MKKGFVVAAFLGVAFAADPPRGTMSLFHPVISRA